MFSNDPVLIFLNFKINFQIQIIEVESKCIFLKASSTVAGTDNTYIVGKYPGSNTGSGFITF